MLYTPSTNKRSSRGLYGVVTSTGPSGPWMRRLSFPVQTNTPPAINWRHTFLTTKQNWSVLVADQTGNPSNHGLADSQAWELQAASYFGILQPGPVENGIQLSGRLVGCATPDAFYTMCQANRASLGLAPLSPPQFQDSYIGSTLTSDNTTVNGYTFVLAALAAPTGDPLNLYFLATVSVPGNHTDTFTASASGLPAGVTAAFSPDPVALAYSGVDGQSHASISLTLTIAPDTAPAGATATVTITSTPATANLGLPVAVTTGPLVSVLSPPAFGFPNSLGASVYYKPDFTVLGIGLTYSAVGQVNFPAKRFGVELPGIWEILASDAYTSSYSPPDPASWQPIIFSGPYMPTPQNVLAAWQAIYGDLPASGNIKFQVFYIDPLTGTSGPALSATAGWAVGTLKGFSRAAWSGPLFGWNAVPYDVSISCPGTNSQAIAVYGLNGYGGTITFTPESSTVIYTGANSTKKALPAGLTFTVTPSSVTIPPGSSTPMSATVTLTAISGAQQFAGPVKVKAADTLSSTSATFELTLGGTVTPQPPPDFLTVSPSNANPSPGSPGSAVVAYTLSNTGPDDIDVSMSAASPNTDITLNFDVYAFTVPAGTLSSPGTATTSLTVTVPANINTSGIQVQVSAGAGNFTAQAGVFLT